MYGALRKALFQVDPETAHRLAAAAMAPMHRSDAARALAGARPDPRLAIDLAGIHAPTPLGIAAGFDKEAHVYNALLGLGFGHVEIGTVTPRPQPGNDRPRIERLPTAKALVNRMGFPGPGKAAVARRLDRVAPIGVLGSNIGPNKTTAPEAVPDDIRATAAELAPRSAYLTINVSSPNTPGLRAFQEPAAVAALVTTALEAANDAGASRPVLLKLHPDAEDAETLEVARAAVDAGAAGIVAVNTTKARPVPATMDGGLSGPPLLERARHVIALLHHGLGRDTPIIGVGGISTGDDAWGHICAGATWVQAYTGFIYEGPKMATRINKGLARHLDAAGLDGLEEAVGADAA